MTNREVGQDLPSRQQFRNWRTCQKCGRTVLDSTARKVGWLIAPYKQNPEFDVVRCPLDITDWALRQSVGRTKLWRERALPGRQLRAQERHEAVISPAPLVDKP
jgi:hypothetical protein